MLPSKVEKGAGQLAGGAASFAQWGWRALWGKSHGSPERVMPKGCKVGKGQKPLGGPQRVTFPCRRICGQWGHPPALGPAGLLHLLSILAQVTQARAELGRGAGYTAQGQKSRSNYPEPVEVQTRNAKRTPIYEQKTGGGGLWDLQRRGRKKGLGASQESPPAKEAQPLRSEQGLRLAQADLWKAEPKQAKGLGLPRPCPTSSLTPLLDQDGPSRPCPKPCWGSASQSHGSSGTFAPALS